MEQSAFSSSLKMIPRITGGAEVCGQVVPGNTLGTGWGLWEEVSTQSENSCFACWISASIHCVPASIPVKDSLVPGAGNVLWHPGSQRGQWWVRQSQLQLKRASDIYVTWESLLAFGTCSFAPTLTRWLCAFCCLLPRLFCLLLYSRPTCGKPIFSQGLRAPNQGDFQSALVHESHHSMRTLLQLPHWFNSGIFLPRFSPIFFIKKMIFMLMLTGSPPPRTLSHAHSPSTLCCIVQAK